MKLSKALLALGLGSILAIVGLQFGIPRLVNRNIAMGCTALTDSGEVDPTDTVAIWENQIFDPVLASASNLTSEDRRVLGVSSDEKWIEVDLSDQKLIAHDGDKVFFETLISSGLTNRTPKGEYRIWYKIVSTKMEGGIKGQRSYYYLPNVPFDMFFNGDIGIHGAYWHNNFGHPMSHGCVNTPISAAEKLFYWTDPQLPEGKKSVRATKENPGTRVVVHD